MIIKEKTSSLKAVGLEALLRRLPKSHPRYPDIENELRITRAGDNGERILADVFDKYQFPFEHYIFHDLNLQSTGKFQIDTLFLCQQGAVILEMKNIAGQINFREEYNQLTRTLENGQVDAFECPSVQLERNKMLLEDWFHAHQFSIPIHQAAVFPRPQQQFVNHREDLTILFPFEIPTFLRRLNSFHSVPNSLPLEEIAKMLYSAHRDYDPFPLISKYGIQPSELFTGVCCVQCGFHGMKSIYNGWGCQQCGHVDEKAHIQAILDYFMLIGYRFTNKEFRQFLRLECRQKAKRLLMQMEIPSEGENKGRCYVADIKTIRKLH
ncbi:nuclease-related domain-containing protein [Sporosarcina highlanderae]|uniref:Nuclease-related domain-containing protein n=1 Tax=Sporosarcina highlanderae TaxID=3035916 RepID=A0ABT8JNI3_9BACL|nr:nuclease-related domain-containing protein [Sporosarcina highlanderae]MDN4606710.1 nuclease-related domain-containing protein [Sporosarcina highlanderae]